MYIRVWRSLIARSAWDGEVASLNLATRTNLSVDTQAATGAGCKPVASGFVGSSPTLPTNMVVSSKGRTIDSQSINQSSILCTTTSSWTSHQRLQQKCVSESYRSLGRRAGRAVLWSHHLSEGYKIFVLKSWVRLPMRLPFIGV